MFAKLLSLILLAVVVVAVAARTSAGGGAERVYVVRAGDTLWAIAATRYGGDPRDAVWRIQQRNNLDGASIRAGQQLILP